ncbi:hypothetical protein ANAPC5_01286 [Anaplasma phagocytophilum]|nr:hypothetical protein ANAPC5_01286 [Anaplasma phagocytophilum]
MSEIPYLPTRSRLWHHSWERFYNRRFHNGKIPVWLELNPFKFSGETETRPERTPWGETRHSEQNADVSLITNVRQNIRVAITSFSGADVKPERLAKVLKPFSHMFTQIPGKTYILEHQIDTGDAQPIRLTRAP